MQPASDQPGGSGGNSSLRRWGPIAAIVVVVAIIAALVLAGGGDDDDTDATASGSASTDTDSTTDVTTADGDVQYPLSFRQAEEAGLEIEWDERCDPDRGQLAIPSFYSAECWAPWPEGEDNGGATERGVTADSVKVVIYLAPEADPVLDYITDAINNDDTNADIKDTITKHVEMLNTYYELYGRKIDVVFYESQGTSTDAATASADAVRVAEEHDPFMVLGGPALTPAFGQELNARGIMCYGCSAGLTRDQTQEINAEVGLNYGGGMDNQQARHHNIEALVNQVAGQNAIYAGDESFHDQERKFGYLYIETTEASAKSAQDYKAALAERGVELAEMVPYALDPATLQETAANAITRLKSAGVTTVIFAGDPIAPRDFTNEATAQEYFPEWFLNLSVLIDTNVFSRTYDQEQWSHAFGITALSTRIAAGAEGEITGRKIYEWFTGEEPAAIDTIGVLVPGPNFVANMLQGAGPNLTYQSFNDAVFAYEPVRTGGVIAPHATWGDHGFWDRLDGPDWDGIDDVTKIWWDPEDVGEDEIQNEGPGVWQFVDGGERLFVDEWEEGDFGAFDRERSVGILDSAPEDESPPSDYEPLPVKG
jgi:hypothetical protein